MSAASGGAALFRALRAECAKLRRARVVAAPVLVPALFIALKAVAFGARGEAGLGAERFTHGYFLSTGAFFWERMLVPLLAVAVCAWLVWLEEESGQWKVLLCQPLPRGAIFASKLAIAWAAIFLLQACWWGFHSLCGVGLGLHGADAIAPAGRHAMLLAAGLAPLIGAQMLLSVLLRSPFTAIAAGVVGNTASLILQGTAVNDWHPWGLAQAAGASTAGPSIMLAALGAGAALAWAGAFRLARREF